MAVDKLVDSVQLDGAITATANAIRAKGNYESDIVWNMNTGFSSDVSAIDDWHKPDDYPDIESVTLPGSNDTNTIYFLYDRKLECDDVNIRIYPGSTLSKGTVANNAFVGEIVAQNQGNVPTEYTDTLESEYTVYKLEGNYYTFGFRYGVIQSYPTTVQSVVWIYGEAPAITLIGFSSEEALYGRYTKKFVLKNTRLLSSVTLPTGCNDRIFSKPYSSFYLGVNSNGDFGNNQITRVGNGPLLYFNGRSQKNLVVQNATMSIGASKFRKSVSGRIKFKNITGELPGQAFQDGFYVESIEIEDCDITCSSMFYQFTNCNDLVNCDLSEVDFTNATDSTNAFNGCYSLKELKLNNTWTMDLNISGCVSLKKSSILDIFDVLPTVNSTKTITLPYGIKKYLIDENDIAIVTEKGWTVA